MEVTIAYVSPKTEDKNGLAGRFFTDGKDLWTRVGNKLRLERAKWFSCRDPKFFKDIVVGTVIDIED